MKAVLVQISYFSMSKTMRVEALLLLLAHLLSPTLGEETIDSGWLASSESF